VARYGEFVLLRPRFSAQTALLWLAPAFVLLIGILGLAWVARRRRAGTGLIGESGLTSAEEARLAEILRRPDAPAS
jgi:cytochrome c-type biogenesis protein CcmH